MKRTLLLLMICVMLTACDKDENGNFLSMNYLTATINGVEYIDRQPINMWLSTTPKAQYFAYHVSSGLSDMLVIDSVCSPETEGAGKTYNIQLVITDFPMNDTWNGFEVEFQCMPDGMNVNDLAHMVGFINSGAKAVAKVSTDTEQFTLDGTLRITDENQPWFHADLELHHGENFVLSGKMYASIK